MNYPSAASWAQICLRGMISKILPERRGILILDGVKLRIRANKQNARESDDQMMR